MATYFRLGYRPALDGLRGVAVLAVMCVHFNVPHASAGFLGVDVFFALSGFLITTLLVEEWHDRGRISLPRFYLRRGLRLFPALWLLLLVISPLEPVSHILITLVYGANWAIAYGLMNFSSYLIPHVWSLSIEEQFYLLWPSMLVVMLRLRVPWRLLLAIPLALVASSNVLRIVLWQRGAAWYRIYAGTDTHCDGLLLGSALALAIAFGVMPHWERIRRPLQAATLLVPIGVAAAIPLGQRWSLYFQGGYLAVALAVVVLISRVTIYPSEVVLRLLSWKPLVATGRISYGLYLWHYPVHAYISARSPVSLPLPYRIPLEVALSFAVAVMSFYCLERPALRLKDRLAARPQGAPAAPSTLTAG